MNIQYRVGLCDGTGPFVVEVLESDASGAHVRDIATGAVYRIRRVEQLFATWDEAKSAVLDFHLFQIQLAEDKLASARQHLRELVAMREPKHDA